MSANDALLQKYSPDQPRVSAGNSDGGQWTSEGGSNASNDLPITSDATPDNPWRPGAQYAQVTVQNNATTNNAAVDRTTEKLL